MEQEPETNNKKAVTRKGPFDRLEQFLDTIWRE